MKQRSRRDTLFVICALCTLNACDSVSHDGKNPSPELSNTECFGIEALGRYHGCRWQEPEASSLGESPLCNYFHARRRFRVDARCPKSKDRKFGQDNEKYLFEDVEDGRIRGEYIREE
jgi:hypothetical protein